MFTIEQIWEIHSGVKSGADFPQLIQEMIRVGVLGYNNYVSDGSAVYFGKNGFFLEAEAKYPGLNVAGEGNIEKLKKALKIHQQGQTDYLTFCKQLAEAGVDKWVIDMGDMTCTYYRDGNLMVTEDIPVPA